VPRARSGTLGEAGSGRRAGSNGKQDRRIQVCKKLAVERASDFTTHFTTNEAQMRDKRYREKIAAGVVAADATIMANERISGSE
jgi:hypothetical protein